MVLFLMLTSVLGAADLYAQSSTDLGDLMRRGDVYLDPETRETHTGAVFASF